MNRLFDSFDVLLPRTQADKWAVIACDQFTSEPEYWDGVKELVGDAPSAYHCILPEVELTEASDDRYAGIRRSMSKYLDDGSLAGYPDGFVYVERTLEDGSVRQGLVGVIDLEAFDYHAGSVSLIRPTERTVEERIPARLRIRSNALIELSHVLLLCDDDEFSLIEPFAGEKSSLTCLYDFDLMQGGGHIAGWLVDGERAGRLRAALDSYYSRKAAEMAGTDPIYFAVGDGNHSLAAAKANYERLKALHAESEQTVGSGTVRPDDAALARARYAMVELVNIRSESMVFEPIHRILTGVDTDDLLGFLRSGLGAEAKEADCRTADGFGHGDSAAVQDADTFCLGVCTCEGEQTLEIPACRGDLPVMLIQNALDSYLGSHLGDIDYIHGADTVRHLACRPGAVGLLLPDIDKAGLFRWIAANGPLPRKTFSLGHAREKRYYLEARRL